MNPDLAAAIDVYALGCVAFSCLTGQPPFVRTSPEQLMYAHAHEPPPSIRSIRPEYPPEIDAVFARVLSKDPAARFESARAFVAALESVVNAGAAGQTRPVVMAEPASPAVRARRWIGANQMVAVGGGAVALVAAVALGANLVFAPPKPTAQPTQAAVVPTIGPVVTIAPTAPPPTQPPPTQPPPTDDPNVFPNDFEAELMAMQPLSVDTDTCKREEGKYEDSLAMIVCEGPDGETGTSVFFALYPDATTMKSDYDDINLNAANLASTKGCFDAADEESRQGDPEAANNGWSFKTGTDAGDNQGYLACYPRTDAGVSGVQYIWTYDDLEIMGLWLAPTYARGLDYFD